MSAVYKFRLYVLQAECLDAFFSYIDVMVVTNIVTYDKIFHTLVRLDKRRCVVIVFFYFTTMNIKIYDWSLMTDSNCITLKSDCEKHELIEKRKKKKH